MSFDSEFYALQKKKKKKTAVQTVSSPEKKTSTAQTVSSPLKTTSVTAKKGLTDERDIAPVMKTFQPKTTVSTPQNKSTAVAAVLMGTVGDLGANAASGALGHIEGITDAVGYGVADIADKIGKGTFADKIREKTKESYTQKLFGDAIKTYGEHSLSGDFTDSVAQGLGQIGVSTLGGAILGGVGLAKGAVSAITTGATAMSGFGSGVGQAYEGKATDKEAKTYGMIAGASEALTELLFGGLGKVSKALGHSKGLLSLDDMLAKKVSNIFSNQIMKNIAEFGVKSSAEGVEEVLSGITQAIGKKITYMKDEDLTKLLKDENLLEQFLVGMTTSAMMQSGDLVSSVAGKTDFITGLDQKEQKVIDKAVESRIAEAEKDGKKLSKKDKDKIYNETVKALDEGDIDTDIIESVLGGEKYESYKNLKDKTDTLRDKVNKANEQLQQKYDGLQQEHDSLDSNNLEQASRQKAIKDEQAQIKEQFEKNKGILKELDGDTRLGELKTKVGENVSDLVKDSRLSESYKEKARRKEAFTANLDKYDEKQQAVIKKAVESGILNNTRKTHKFVDFIARISADKGVSFDFTSNEKLKESGFAIEGKTVNGLVTKDGIQINVNSAKALNTVVGHEVMHIFEGTELYTEIQKLVKDAAVKKGEYQSRYDEITRLYEGIKDADINKELTADLVGDYLFSDEDFIRRLSTENRSIFDKLRDEINYLCRIATAGSAEARKLEQAKKLFEKVYREAEAKINTAEGGVRYSIVSDGQGKYVKVDVKQNLFDGKNIREMQNIARNVIKDNFRGNVFPVGAEGKAYINKRSADEYAYPANRRINDTIKEAKMRSSVELDNLLAVSEFVENEPDDGSHPEATGGWDIYNTRFEVAGVMFDGKVKIMVTDRGYVFYDITKIKRLPVNGGQTETNSVAASGNLSNNSISNFTENVKQNSKMSLSSPDTAPKKYGDYAVYGEDVMLEGEVKPKGKAEITAPTAKKEITAPMRADVNPLKNEQVPLLTEKQIAELKKMDMNTFVSWEAQELYNELMGYKRVDKASEQIEYLLEQGVSEKEMIEALRRFITYPEEIVNPLSESEMTVAELLELDYQHRVDESGTGRLVLDALEYKNQLEKAEKDFKEDREAAESLTDADMPPQAEAPIYSADTLPLNKKTLKNVSSVGGKILMLNAKEKRSLTELIQKYSTSEDMDSEALFGEIKKLFGEKSFTERIEEVANVRQALSGYRIGVSSYIKNGMSDYAEFRKRNFGKLLIANDGVPVDTAYMELSEAYPDFFPSDIVNPTDQLLQMAEVANMERDITSTYEVDDDVIREATETIGDMVGTYQEKQLIKATEKEGKAILRDEERRARQQQSEADKARRQAEKEAEPTRSKLHKSIVDGIKAKFTEKGLDFDKVLKNAKNLGALRLNDNTPQRAMEKTLGPKAGRILADATVNKVALNESEGIKWLNSYLDRKNGILAQISKQYKIKPGSKESAAAQMYAEGFYVDERAKDKPIYAYGDEELAKDFPDPNVQERIKGLAKDERIRKIYDETLEKINESRKRNLFPEIPRRDDYFLHFRAMGDTFSTLGLPFNPNDIRAKDLPTDLNGVTADLKPGQPYFASANRRKGKRTSFDLLGGLEQYLTSAKNQIYHIDDIQNLRAVRNYLADSFGQNILDNLDTLSDEEVDFRIEQVYKSHLSNFARFLNEEANVLAGKTALIDRGLEGFVGRRGMTFLKTLNGQVGANMVGFNISSSLTNFLPVVQTVAKSSKGAFVKAFVQMSTNNIKSVFKKETDGFAENSPVIIRRKGAEQFYRKPYQKIGDVGYLLMSVVDNVSTELIARTKFNEFTKKGMDEQAAHIETDKWVSRLMGDRSLGQQPLLYNSKTLGIITKFQLEVRNQLDSQFYDTIQEAKISNEEIENRLLRNAKTAAQVMSTFVQLAVLQHIFGQAFERVAGYNPAFDIIEVLAKMFGYGDDEEDEDTVLDNLGEGFLALLEDLPYTSTFTGGRIPISSALPSWENIEQIVTGEDESGNKKSRLETAAKVFDEIAPYYILPGGAGQIKKTAKGLKMFDDDLPVAGSYTESGKLRFPVDETPWNVAQAAVFGQYANGNAREYFDEGYAPLNEKQTKEFIDSDLPIADYWEYREGLSKLEPEKGKKQVTLNQKGDYIGSLDLPMKAKNVLINSIADRETPIDMRTYSKYKDFEEFDFATKNPDIYKVLKEEGITVKEYKEKYEKSVFMRTDDFAWAAQNPETYTFSKAVTDNVTEYKKYTSELYKIRGDKDSKGNTISGSTKKKKKAYIWNLDLDWGAKYVLFKKEYPKDDTYNREIIDYVNKQKLTYDEKVTVLEEMGFKVASNGRISWD